MQKLSTCLWFDGKAEEAMNFYISIFKNSKKGKISRYGDGAPMPNGTVIVRTPWARIYGVEWWPAVYFFPSHLVRCEL